MISSEQMLLIEKYFSGQLDEKELGTFENLVSCDKEFREEVNRRSSFEADLSSLGIAGESEGEQVMEDYLIHSQVLAPTEEEKLEASGQISENDWNEIIKGAVGTAFEPSKSRITFFRKYAGFLVAACLVGVVMAGYAARDFLIKRLTSEESSAEAGMFIKGQKQNAFVKDSLVQYEGGAVLVEKNSVAFLDSSLTSDDSEVRLVRGRLLFASQKEGGKEIRITTPQATVSSCEAVASVSAESGITVVSVDSGSVKVRPKEGGRETEVGAFSAVVAGKDSVLTFLPGLDLGNVRKRKLLEDFLKRTSVDIPETGFGFGSETGKDDCGLEELFGILADGESEPSGVVQAFRELPDSVFDESSVSLIIRRLEKKMEKDESLVLLDSLSSVVRDEFLRQMIIYEMAGVNLALKDTASAIKSYLSAFDMKPGSKLGEECLVRILLSGYAGKFDVKRDSILDLYLKVHGSGNRAEDVLFAYADNVRNEAADYLHAVELYEKLIALFPDSRHRDDAVYWIGWCLIQERISRRSSGINREKLFRPDGHLF